MSNQAEKFDPSYGYSLTDLLAITTPEAPKDFDSFWQNAYADCHDIQPKPKFIDTGAIHKNWRVFEIQYISTNDMKIGGWILIPQDKPPTRGFVVGHGYGGRDEPDYNLPFDDAAILFPCCRGISKSPNFPISSNPQWHVLHDIDKPDRYIIRGCVEDTWLAVSCLLALFPYLAGHLGYLGVSFSGGVGALAMAYEKRIARAHFNVPTFGNHQLRLKLPTWGSGESLRQFYRKKPDMLLNTLKYFDAANAAERINMPVHCALALKDPVVAPPGQFAVYNALKCEKHLYVLDEGHAEYPTQEQQKIELRQQLVEFFSPI
ncbi:alpha/beta hydrolase [Saccharobesus litoralis]|uniref:Alpha/beta hydrolase n=1 Tax=Saccharobesus litoralis TaxID=2172099 RepID=A0A2S0VQ70_9ALTE|nr:acetylxylan esterase [Saccharobesus litoralis]AWB66230.1 alpha/beta hydrolase [Saccharobesus litoralis]